MPYLVVLAIGAGLGVYGASKGEDLVKYALIGGGIYVAGKYVKAW